MTASRDTFFASTAAAVSTAPPKIAVQITTNPETRICAVDLGLDTHLAVCTVQTVDGGVSEAAGL